MPGKTATYLISSQRKAFRIRRIGTTLALATAVAAAGCGQGTAFAPTGAISSSWVTPEPAVHGYGNDAMYSSQPSSNGVAWYRRKQNSLTLKFKETLTSGFSSPMGMVTTPDGRLYVANSGDSNVPVYRTARGGPEGPVQTLGDAAEVPIDVAVTPNRRLVAVSNASTTGGGPGSVSVYLNRHDEPSRVLSYGSDPIAGQGVAIDSNGNCYWSFNDPKTLSGSIVEFAGCSGSGSVFKSGILDVGGLAFDGSGNLYYVDQFVGIYRCNGESCALWLSISGLGGLILPKNINFDTSKPQNLWIADGAGYIDAANLDGVIEYIVEVIGGATDPPVGIAPAPGS